MQKLSNDLKKNRITWDTIDRSCNVQSTLEANHVNFRKIIKKGIPQITWLTEPKMQNNLNLKITASPINGKEFMKNVSWRKKSHPSWHLPAQS